MCSHINVGTGRDVTIAELATMMARIVEFEGDIEFDTSKPDGTPRKLLDVSRVCSLGWESSVALESGLGMTYEWFLNIFMSFVAEISIFSTSPMIKEFKFATNF